MFVGRKKELVYLEDFYQKGHNNIICLYGRKGIGKTSLLLKFANGKNNCYYKCRPCSEDEQLQLFAAEQNISYKYSANYSELFNNILFEQNGKKILILDEFQNWVKTSDYFIPELIKFVKEQADGILVILCSSSISFIENSLVPKIGSYAQSFSAFYKVMPLAFTDIVNYFSQYSTYECIEVYSLLGGNPSYWSHFTDSKSVKQNVIDSLLSDNSVLRYEADNLINEELRESSVYSTILYCLANGMNKLNELHIHTGFSRAKISVYIKNLMEREFVEKVFSFENASTANSMKGVYRISNPYIHFYFKYIYKNESALIKMGCDKFYNEYIDNYLDEFVDEHFRSVCFEFLSILNNMNKLPIKADKVGEWIGKNGDIDVIMQNDDDSLVCFCDWKKEKITMDDYKRYLSIANDSRVHIDYMIILAKGDFSEELLETEKTSEILQLIQANTL